MDPFSVTLTSVGTAFSWLMFRPDTSSCAVILPSLGERCSEQLKLYSSLGQVSTSDQVSHS